jgi:hypothetical protein
MSSYIVQLRGHAGQQTQQSNSASRKTSTKQLSTVETLHRWTEMVVMVMGR